MKKLFSKQLLTLSAALLLGGCQFIDNVEFADATGTRPPAVDFGKVAVQGCPAVRELRLVNRGFGPVDSLEVELSAEGEAFHSPAVVSQIAYPMSSSCAQPTTVRGAVSMDRVAVAPDDSGTGYTSEPIGGDNPSLPADPLCGAEANALEPGQSCRLPVYFQPSKAGVQQARLLIRYRGQYGQHNLQRSLVGEGTDVQTSKGLVQFKSLGRPAFPGRRQASLAVLKDQVFMTGGERVSDVWSSKDGKNWNLLTDRAPFGGQYGADYHKMIAYNDSLYVFALWNGDRGVWKSRDGIAWTKVATLGSRSNYCALTHQGQILILGGWKGEFSNDILVSKDGVTFTQETTTRPFPARMDMRCVSNGRQVFLIGGHSGNSEMKDVWMSMDGKAWVQLTNDYGARHFSSATDVVFHQDNLVILDSDQAYLSKDGKSFTAIPATHRELWERGDTVVFQDRLLSLTTPYEGSQYANQMFLGTLKLAK